jgi:iron complex outermembrane receptor protein
MSQMSARAGLVRMMEVRSHNTMRAIVGAALCAGAALAATPIAMAQTAPAASAQQPGAADDKGALQEVVVTAQFRKQNLQDTPIAMTAVTAETLQERNQTNLADVTNQAPNVVLKETGGAFGPGMSAYIRGIGQADFNPALEPGVGIYVDDVYYPSLTGANFDLLDLDRVEVLRGPQGTLAGRNSEGGAIKLYSAKPQGDDSGDVRATYGARDLIDLRGMANFSLIKDTLFMRISAVSKHQNGYLTVQDYGCTHPNNPFGIPNTSQQGDCTVGHEGGKDYSAGRLALRWLASESVEVNFASDITVDNSEVAAKTLIGTAPVKTPNLGPVPWGSQYLPPNPFVSYATYSDFIPTNYATGAGYYVHWNPTTHTQVAGSNLNVDWTISDSLTFKSITAYRTFDSSFVDDGSGSPASLGIGANTQHNHEVSEELRLNGKVGSFLDYTIGGYFFDELTRYETHQILNYVNFGFPYLFNFLGNDPVRSVSDAGFANASLHFTDKLTLDVGLRYTTERKDYTYSRLNPDGTPNVILAALNGDTGRYSGSKLDYRVNLNYRWNDELMTYASVSTGFRGGGVNPRPFDAKQVLPFGQETLTAYEVGAKSDLLDRRLRLNLSLFENRYTDIQTTLLQCPNDPGPPCALPLNVGNANIKGAELELEAHPTQHWSIDGSWSYLNFRYTSFNQPVGIPAGASEPGLIRSKYSIGTQYEALLPNGSSIVPRVDFSYTGGFYTNAIPSAGSEVGGYHLLNARLTYKTADDKWEISANGSNLLNKIYYISVFDLTSVGAGADFALVAPPREWSIQVEHKF